MWARSSCGAPTPSSSSRTPTSGSSRRSPGPDRPPRAARVHPRVHGAVADAAAGHDRPARRARPRRGSEFALSLDLRFGAIGRAILGQPEVRSASSRRERHPAPPRLMGRSRALEVVLGCEDFDAELAERYGWINRALPAAEIGPFVERLARRIAAFPAPGGAAGEAPSRPPAARSRTASSKSRIASISRSPIHSSTPAWKELWRGAQTRRAKWTFRADRGLVTPCSAR